MKLFMEQAKIAVSLCKALERESLIILMSVFTLQGV